MTKKNVAVTSFRLKQARIMTGLSRNEFQKKTGMSENSLRAWESGVNPVRPQTAYLLCLALEKCGVACTPEWILEGVGDEPRLRKNNLRVPTSSIELVNIQREISAFKLGNKNPIVQIIPDDIMQPFFSKNDYVGGYDFEKPVKLDYFQSKFCIVELNSGETVVRSLIVDRIKNEFGLIGSNFLCADQDSFYISTAKIKKISQVIWHRKV